MRAEVRPIRVAFRSHRSRPFALLARWPTTEVLGRNEGQPRLSASGTLSPNPCQGRLPLDPEVLFSWSTGVAPRYPPRQRRSRPSMTPDTSGGGPQPPIPAIQAEAG